MEKITMGQITMKKAIVEKITITKIWRWGEKNTKVELVGRLISTLVLLFVFLIGVKALSTGLTMLGGDFARQLFDFTNRPFLSLMAGMLATVLFQSSSVTTAIIVGLVSSGILSIGGAVPMIMGANLGTSVTNSLVSLGYMRNTANFKRAFAAATVHDFFNILTVTILLPLELAFGFIEKMATTMAAMMYGSISGIHYASPIKAAIKPAVTALKSIVLQLFGTEYSGLIMIGLAGIIIIGALALIVRLMKVLVASNSGEIINRILSQNTVVTLMFGVLVTIAVQSSSITTSLLVPMAASGLLNLNVVFSITVGANIGTTATAMLAALTGNVAGLAIALVHLLFNIFGMLLFFVHPSLRQIPIKCADYLAESVEKTKLVGFGYVGTVFFLFPLSVIYLFK